MAELCLTETPRIELLRRGKTLRVAVFRLEFGYGWTVFFDIWLINLFHSFIDEQIKVFLFMPYFDGLHC